MFALMCAAATVVLPSGISAQEMFGTLRRADIDAPARGAIVVAERVDDGQVIARAVTGAQGTWRLRLTTDRLVLRALRIGFAPHVLDTVQLAVGERLELHAILPGTNVVLPTVRTATDDRCRVRPDSASLVARLFDAARTALAASQLISLDGPLETRVRVTNETWSYDEERVLESGHREYFSDSLRPFGTASVDSLLEFGFVTRHYQRYAGVKRPIEVAVDYRVPSTDLLVDDRFLSDYCLQLADAHGGHPEWIGVEFRPAEGNRRITLLEGTLWLDRRTVELQLLEFGYAGLIGNEARIAPGGWMEFTRLANGLWFVNRWALRMPALGEWIETSARETLRVGVREIPVIRVHGEVLDLAVDSRAVFTVGSTDVLSQTGALVPVPFSVDSTLPECDDAPDQAFVSGTVVSATGPVLPAAELRLYWRDKGTDAAWLQSGTRSLTTGQYRVCGLPQDRLITVEVRAGGHEPAAIALRVGSPRTAARLDLVLVPTATQPDVP